MPLTANKLFKVNISEDRLLATMSLNGQAPPAYTVTVDDILDELKLLKIAVDDQGKKNIVAFAGQLANQQVPKAMVIARGTPAKHDKNGRVEKLFSTAQVQTEADTTKQTDVQDGSALSSQSYYDRSGIVTVKDGESLVRLIPPVSGKDGVDIYGQGISRRSGIEATMKAGKNVRQEGNTFYATTAGMVLCENNKVWVETKLEIKENVDFSVGNIDFDGDVEVHKNVLDLFKVHSRSSVTVHGIIEAAEVRAEIDVNALGGIAGKEKGTIFASNNVNSKYITNATVHAEHDIIVRNEVIQSDLFCKGRLSVASGQLVGGHVIATCGVIVHDLGSEAGTKTIVEAGVDRDLTDKITHIIPEVRRLRMKAEKVRQVIEPLIQHQKYLPAGQRKKVAELLQLSYGLDEQAENLIGELRAAYEKSQEMAVTEVEVTGKVFAGVTIQFPRGECCITTPIKGPVKIIPQKIKKNTRMVSVNSNTGETTILDANGIASELWNAMDELLRSLKE